MHYFASIYLHFGSGLTAVELLDILDNLLDNLAEDIIY